MKILFALNGLAVIALFTTSALNYVDPSLCPAVWSDYCAIACAIAWAVIALLLVLYIIIILLD